jgi:hypothetical protein
MVDCESEKGDEKEFFDERPHSVFCHSRVVVSEEEKSFMGELDSELSRVKRHKDMENMAEASRELGRPMILVEPVDSYIPS